MIKNFKVFNESLLDKMVGPSEEDIIQQLKHVPINLYITSKEGNFKNGMKVALDLLKSYEPDTLFHAAMVKGEYELIKLALEIGADINMFNSAAIKNTSSPNIVKLLLEYGADINANDNKPLYKSIITNNFDVYKILLENGADVYNHNILELLFSRNRKRFIRFLIDNHHIDYNKMSKENKHHMNIYLDKEDVQKIKQGF